VPAPKPASDAVDAVDAVDATDAADGADAPQEPRLFRLRAFRRNRSRLGVRARVTVTFGLGALALSATMAGLTYLTARQFILNERQTAILRQAYVNASLIRAALRSPNPDVP
jgi:hypothetical protein